MKIEVQFFSRLREVAGVGQRELDLPERATVGEALARLFADYPLMRKWDTSLLLAVGLDFAPRTQELHDGENLSVMPPVQGG